MDEEKSSSVKSPKNKNLGILIMTLCIVLVVIVLIIVIAVNSGNDDETTPQESTTPSVSDSDNVSDAPSESENQPGSSTPESTGTVPESTSAPESTSKPTPVDPVDPTISETVSKAPAEGKVTLNNNSTSEGNLVLVDGTHTYTQSFKGNANTDPEDAESAGFAMLYHAYPGYMLVNRDAFLRSEAAKALDALIKTFQSVASSDVTFRVRGLKSTTAVTDDFITGNVVGLYTWLRSSEGNPYGFNYSLNKVTVNGKSMTYDVWFKNNCAKYGFYYAGLIGNDKNFLEGKLVYVGSIHAAGVTAAGGLDKYLAAVKAGTVTSATAADGSVWTVKYQAASTNGNQTEVEIPAGASYVVSGDNMGGFIIAYRTAE